MLKVKHYLCSEGARPDFPENTFAPFGIGHLSVLEQSSAENRSHLTLCERNALSRYYARGRQLLCSSCIFPLDSLSYPAQQVRSFLAFPSASSLAPCSSFLSAKHSRLATSARRFASLNERLHLLSSSSARLAAPRVENASLSSSSALVASLQLVLRWVILVREPLG